MAKAKVETRVYGDTAADIEVAAHQAARDFFITGDVIYVIEDYTAKDCLSGRTLFYADITITQQ